MSLLLVSFSVLLFVAVNAVCPDQGTFAFTFSDASSQYIDGSIITIPAGESWLFDLANSPKYSNIEVYGTLVFKDASDVQLNAQNIFVHSTGKFLIGGCDCPFTHKAIIELQSVPDQTANPYGVGVKVIGAVGGGIILFYGEVRGPTWTTLDATANAGATTLTLSESVAWRVGDVLALAPTGYTSYQDVNNPYNWKDWSENVTITAVSGATVTFTPALKYQHYSGIHNLVEETGEVALLTRNIVVRGDAASLTDGFGAHMMFLKGSFVQLSGVEVTRAGQFTHLGRYPVHWHMAGDVTGQFIYDSSLHNNFQRCLTVHGTNSLSIFRNVGYKTRGHMFFLEDGIESNNNFSWNLGMVVYKIAPANQLSAIHSDDTPAIFWITNPGNTFTHNVAAGASDHCFWFALPINPSGPSNTRYNIPRWTPLQKFAYNKAHSCGNDCLHIDNGPNQAGVAGGDDLTSVSTFTFTDASGNPQSFSVGDGYFPTSNLNQLTLTNWEFYKNSTPPVNANFEAFTAYKCRNRAVWARGHDMTFTHPRFADNAIGITIAAGSYCLVQDAVMIKQTPNYGNNVSQYELDNGLYGLINNNPAAPFREIPKNYPPISQITTGNEMGPFYPTRGYEFYDGPNEIKTSRFYGFVPDSRARSSAISMLRQDRFSISASNRGTGIYSDSPVNMILFPDLFHDGDKASVFLDTDGTVTGRTPLTADNIPVVVNSHPFYNTAGCTYNAVQMISVCPNHFVSMGFKFNSAVVYPADLTALQGLVKIQRPDLVGTPLYVCGGPCNGGYEVVDKLVAADSFFGTLMLYRTYYFSWLTSTVPSDFSFQFGNHRSSVNGDGAAPYNELTMAFCYPGGTVVNTVMWNWKSPVTEATSLAAMKTQVYDTTWANLGNGMWFHDKATNWVYVRMIIPYSQNTTPIGFGNGAWINIKATISLLPTPCTVPSVADNSIPDTLRTVPPVTAYAAAPLPWTAPPPTPLPRASLPAISCSINITTSTAPPTAPSNGMSAGAVAGIVIGVLLGLAAAGAVIALIVLKTGAHHSLVATESF